MTYHSLFKEINENVPVQDILTQGKYMLYQGFNITKVNYSHKGSSLKYYARKQILKVPQCGVTINHIKSKVQFLT